MKKLFGLTLLQGVLLSLLPGACRVKGAPAPLPKDKGRFCCPCCPCCDCLLPCHCVPPAERVRTEDLTGDWDYCYGDCPYLLILEPGGRYVAAVTGASNWYEGRWSYDQATGILQVMNERYIFGAGISDGKGYSSKWNLRLYRRGSGVLEFTPTGHYCSPTKLSNRRAPGPRF